MQQRKFSAVSEDPYFSKEQVNIAFVGDQGLGNNSVRVLEMIKAWGADLIVIPGDFDYVDNPPAFINQFKAVMGQDFPLLAAPGNHDILYWFDEDAGYKAVLENQMKRSGLAKHCTGDTGINSYCILNDMIIILSGVGTLGTDHAQFIDETFTTYHNITWKICVWHKNQAKLQTGDKEDETGYMVYESCRKHGAFVITGHEHSYERTHLLSNFETQKVATRSNVLNVEPGLSFATVVGLGGDSIRPWRYNNQRNPWWAAKAALDNGVSYGAMLCTFKFSDQIAECVFQDINDVLWDKFTIKPTVKSISATTLPETVSQFEEITMEANELGPLYLNSSHILNFKLPDIIKDAKKINLQLMMRFGRWKNHNGTLDISLALPFSPLRFQNPKNELVISTGIENLESGEVWVSPNIISLFGPVIPQRIRLKISAREMNHVAIMSLDQNLDGCLLPTLTVVT